MCSQLQITSQLSFIAAQLQWRREGHERLENRGDGSIDHRMSQSIAAGKCPQTCQSLPQVEQDSTVLIKAAIDVYR